MFTSLYKSRALFAAVASAAVLNVQAVAAPQTVNLSNRAVTSGIINGAIYMVEPRRRGGRH